MASACVNNIGMSPENFLDFSPAKHSSYGWLSPRISFSREFPEEEACGGKDSSQLQTASSAAAEETNPEALCTDIGDFEFLLEDPVTMLPADELFANGKLVPMHLSTVRTAVTSSEPATPEVRSATDMPKLLRRRNEISVTDPYLFSPKAPSCSIRWKELLALKKLYSKNNGKQRHNEENTTTSSPSAANVSKSLKFDNANREGVVTPSSSSSASKFFRSNNGKHGNNNETTSSSSSSTNAAKSLKGLLNRSSKSSTPSSSLSNASLSLPLLKDIENDTVVISSLSRLSLSSSSSSGLDHDDLPRLSMDINEKALTRKSISAQPTANQNHHRARIVKPRPSSASSTSSSSSSSSENATIIGFGVSADSPRMNPSGKIVFQSLERSSSSPGSFTGGPRHSKHRAAMERSKSANVVRVTPVLNVCSVRSSSKSGGVFGFPLFSSPHPKKEAHHHIHNKF